MKIALAVLCSLSAAWAADSPADRIRAAAAKAVTLIQKSQQNWYAKQSCFSCHQQILPSLAFRAAREHGIPVNETAAHAGAAAAFGFYSNLERAVEYTHIIDPAMSDSYGLLAADAAGVKPSLVTAVYARLLAARQEADGHWETVDERPPQSYSPFTATAVSARAVRLYAHDKFDAQTRAERARQWLVSHTPRVTEERTFQLLGAFWTGADRSALRTMAAALAATQQGDGGWNSLDSRPSDAYSTSEALFALHEAGGVAITDAAWRRGIEYLLKTQASDGSWHVLSRLHPPAPVSPPYFETGFPYGHDQFLSAMGTSWAVMALAEALGPAKPVSMNLKEAEPAPAGDWVEAVLFGSVADLKKLLDGLNPNASVREGGPTALMLAAPDMDKMKLLLDRGAAADARTKDRYSALLVTAQYPNSGAAINLLLDHGVHVRLPKGQGAPMFNAFPVFLAAFSGNNAVIGRLHQQGDRLDDKMNLIGMFPTSPMLALATTHRTDAMRALLDAGAQLDETDGDGITALGWAAIANRLDMARLLIQRGADVNHVDKKGMTPLLYAASIDFGDATMIDLLVHSGARPGLRTKEGLSALDLARKYGHAHLVTSLQRDLAGLKF